MIKCRMKHEEQEVFFETWKEIAQFLDVDVRTCQRWEKDFGLPVYRQAGAHKSRVYARKEELIRFRKEFLKPGNGKPAPPSQAPDNNSDSKKAFIYSAMGTGTIVLLFLVIYSGLNLFKSPGPPADFKIEDNTLFILDADKNVIRRYKSDSNHRLREEQAYRNRFLKGNMIPPETELSYLKIIDLEGDGKREVLYCVVHTSYTDSEFVVFNGDGSIRFRHKENKAVKTGSEEFSADYKIFGVETCDFDNDGKLEIMLITMQMAHHPCQVMVFNHQGRSLGEYWHSGYLNSCLFLDLNSDNKKEIILGGTNNETDAACLVVLDPFNLKGCSPQRTEAQRLQGFSRGRELYYIRFPQTDVIKVQKKVDAADRLMIQKNNLIQVRMQKSKLFYELDLQLKCMLIRRTDDFIQEHNKAKIDGIISSNLDHQYFEDLRKRILYYDGNTWTDTPTPVIHRQ